MSNGKLPSLNTQAAGLCLIGRNSRGNWVVWEPAGRYGGLFADRVQALKYAMFGNGTRSQAVLMVPGVLELDLDAPSGGEPPSENCQTAGKRLA